MGEPIGLPFNPRSWPPTRTDIVRRELAENLDAIARHIEGHSAREAEVLRGVWALQDLIGAVRPGGNQETRSAENG